MEIVSREEAWVQGSTRYFTGKPCKRGHIAQRSVTSHNCVECRKDYGRQWQRNWYEANLEEGRKRSRENAAKRRANGYKEKKNPETVMAWKARNREELGAKRRAYRAANPEQQRQETYRLRSTVEGTLKHLCRRRGRTHLKDVLLEKFFDQQGRCAISGVTMTWGRAGEGKIPTHISIDRIDPTKNYSADNVQLVCCIVNIMKSDMLHNELVAWCKNIIRTEAARDHI